jgi:hypothetical protein
MRICSGQIVCLRSFGALCGTGWRWWHCRRRWRSRHISNNASFSLKHLAVPDSSDGPAPTSFPLTGNHPWPVDHAVGHVAYLPCGGNYTMPHILATHRIVYYTCLFSVKWPLLCVRNVVTYVHHQNNTDVTLFAGVLVMQSPFT